MFTATSATFVTGLIVVDTGTYWSGFGEAVIFGLIQVGGLGYMTGVAFIVLVARRRLSLGQRQGCASRSAAACLAGSTSKRARSSSCPC